MAKLTAPISVRVRNEIIERLYGVSMSGIGGCVEWGASTPPLSRLRRMPDSLSVRGGYATKHATMGAARFVHCRKKSGELQPQKASSCMVMLDGHIDNLKELRLELLGAGLVKARAKEAAILAAAWGLHGEALFHRLEGEFAIAIWDKNREEIYLYRDRMGVRPLFFSYEFGRLGFASNSRALLTLPLVSSEINRESVSEYLAFRYAWAPKTLLRDIKQLPAGYLAKFTATGYSKLSISKVEWCKPESPPLAGGELVWRLEGALSRAVDRAFLKDKTGLLLSGGVASAAVAAMALRAGADINTYHIALDGLQGDEVSFAGRAAKLFDTNHKNIVVSREEWFDAFGRVVEAVDAPISSTAAVSEYLLCKAVSEDARRVVTGLGADEILAGPTAARLAGELTAIRYLGGLPSPARKGLVGIANRLGFDRLSPSQPHGLARLLGGSNVFGVNGRGSLLREYGLVRPGMRRTVLEPLYNDVHSDPVNQVLHVYGRGWLVEDALARYDRVAAAAGVGIRHPLIDREVVDLCASWPGGVKAKRHRGHWVGKWPLRQIIARHLPPQLVWRRAKRIATPLDNWLRGDGEPFLRERIGGLLEDPWQLFEANEIHRLVSDHCSRERDNGLKLWTLIFFDAWRRSIGVK